MDEINEEDEKGGKLLMLDEAKIFHKKGEK